MMQRILVLYWKQLRAVKRLIFHVIMIVNIILTLQGKKVGTFSKDSFSGEFVDEWKNALDQSKLKQVSVLVYHVTCLLFLYDRLMSVQHLLI